MISILTRLVGRQPVVAAAPERCAGLPRDERAGIPGEDAVLRRLAARTERLNDPWAAAAMTFGGRRG